jgi:signal transduction histidine kinase
LPVPSSDSPVRIVLIDDSNRAGRSVSITLALYATIGAIVTLLGWLLDRQRLTDWNNDGVSMFANTAVGVLCLGVALLIFRCGNNVAWQKSTTRFLATVAALIGGLTIFEHLSGVNLGIDTLLFNRPWGQRATTAPMRMGLPASTSLVILGTAMLLLTDGPHARKIASMLALSVVTIVSLSLIGYWYKADQLFLIPRYTGIAWQTSTMLAALGIGLIAAVPNYGLLAILRRDDAGGLLARRLLLPIIAIPLLLGWLRLVGQQAELYDTAFGTAIRTVFEIILFVGMLWWTADSISRQAQIARAAEEALRHADRRKDEFLATLAHELRNPLAPIGSALQVIKRTDGQDLNLGQARDTIERQFGQMVRLVDDLLDVGRITRDKLELRPQPTELESVIQQAAESCRALAETGQHRLRIALPADPIWVHGDSVRLTQVFSNLLNNACKFTEPGGNINIAVEREGEHAVITVSDTGIGIAPDQLHNIFEMFSQVDQSLERNRSGLGIGLTLVKRLVELHSGSIAANSDGLNRGSTFTVRLPALANEPKSVPEKMSSAKPASSTATDSPKRILITDDNQDAANTMAMLLRLLGHEVEIAYDGPEAIQTAEIYGPEIMLLDIGLPGMNGYDVCRSIRQQPWGKSIRIVALTGWGQEEDRRNAREAGFDDHLVKPVDPQTLRKAIAV